MADKPAGQNESVNNSEPAANGSADTQPGPNRDKLDTKGKQQDQTQPPKFQPPKQARREDMSKFGRLKLDPTRPFQDPRTFSSRLHREGFTPYGWILPCTLFTPGEAPLKYYEIFD